MNETLESIITRRSCRKFQNKKISDDKLNAIIKAGKYAPSARNEQACRFVVLNSRELITELVEVMKKALNNDKYDMYSPEVVIIPVMKKDCEYGVDDSACALENIFIAANSFGIGSCWINQLRRVIEDPDVRNYLKKYDVKPNETVYGIAALGWPAEEGAFHQVDKKEEVEIYNG